MLTYADLRREAQRTAPLVGNYTYKRIVRRGLEPVRRKRVVSADQVPPDPEIFFAADAEHLHTSAYVSIRQHTSAYVSIRQHTCK
jgi:hypothetical protein